MSTNITAVPTHPIAPPPRRRWLRVVLIVGALVILVPLLIYALADHWTQNAWAEAEAEAAADDPRWTLLEIEADRKQIADNDNSALHLIATNRLARGFSVRLVPKYDEIFAKLPPPARLNTQQEQILRRELGKIPKALEEARKLKDMPYGRFPLAYTDDFISTLLPNQQEARTPADWLAHDAMLLAHDEKYDEAVESCRAILNAGRAIGDEPILISFLIRAALQNISVTTLERVLAQGTPTEPALAAMQALLEKEMAECTWVHGVRGERAGIHYLFDNIRAGKVNANYLRAVGPLGVRRPGVSGVVTEAMVNVFPRTALGSYPGHLKFMNRSVAAAKLPPHERAAKLAELDAEVRATSNPITGTLAAALTKVEKADTRCQINLRTAIVAVACERYRLAHKDQWPAALEDLVQAKLLDKVPIDPLHNEPLHYRRNKEFIVIYSIGFDGKDGGGNIDRDQPYQPGVDLGFRLWNVERRRQAPLPPVAIQ
jgi:hypothetical protein